MNPPPWSTEGAKARRDLKSFLNIQIKRGLSTRQIGQLFTNPKTNKPYSQCAVRYTLKKLGLKTKPLRSYKNKPKGDKRECPRCKKTLPLTEEHWNSRRGVECSSAYCRNCQSRGAVERAQKTKQKCVDYLGGACRLCGYDKCLGALHFHHIDPTKKEFAIGGKKTADIKRLILELDKCALLCANCHAEVHSGLIILTET